MPSKRIIGQDYISWLAELKDKIRNSQLRAGLKVNTELLALNWELGKAMTEKQINSTWGDKIITQLAADLTAEFKDLEGFSRSNLFNIRKWYQFYAKDLSIVQQKVGLLTNGNNSQDDLFVQQPVGSFPAILALIPWGHHIQIITKSQTLDEALFYLQQTALNNWKRTVLTYHIESGLYHSKGKAHTNFDIVLPKVQSELAAELLKNPYNLGFLNLSEEVSERDLENAILGNIKKFLLELGVGFSFYGQQYKLKVGDKDFYIDLLFYHTRLHCYFVIELKVADFEPEHAGKLEFYITAIDEQIKLPEDKPTIGLLLCKTADKIIVEYTLKTKTKPMGVAEYKHAIPKEWKNALPDEEALQKELEKEIRLPVKPVDEKIDRLKELVKRFNTPPADTEKSKEIVERIFTEIQIPLMTLVNYKLTEIKLLFKKCRITLKFNQRGHEWDEQTEPDFTLAKEENIWQLGFEYTLDTLIQGGTKAFDVWKTLEIHLDKHKYIIGPDRGKIWEEKVYRQILTKEELESLADRFVELIVEDINHRAESILKVNS